MSTCYYCSWLAHISQKCSGTHMCCVDDKTGFVFRKRSKALFLKLLNLVSFGEIYERLYQTFFFFFYLEDLPLCLQVHSFTQTMAFPDTISLKETRCCGSEWVSTCLQWVLVDSWVWAPALAQYEWLFQIYLIMSARLKQSKSRRGQSFLLQSLYGAHHLPATRQSSVR